MNPSEIENTVKCHVQAQTACAGAKGIGAQGQDETPMPPHGTF